MSPRPHALGKFLYNGSEKFWTKGVTYGTFRPFNGSGEFHPDVVRTDFRMMRQNAINAVRTYTIPPEWFLDLANEFGIAVMLGFPWEEHVTFLDNRVTAQSIRNRLKQSVRDIAGHPAVLCFAIGNEIPSSIVRWHGAEKTQNYLRSLYETAKAVDPGLLVTYANYPSTEYLHLPFLDLFCFNIFLEEKPDFDSYLYRLQNLAGDKPLLLTEIGLDSRRNGLDRQARLLRAQIWSSFRAGCSGVFSFAWTDEWCRGGAEITEWDFGLTDRARNPKPALEAIRRQFSNGLLHPLEPAPKFSVVVCSYNGSKTLDHCLSSLMKLEYPNYEVIVIDDGSTDSTASIASRHPVRLISTENRGLSAARNLGMREARGEIIAYIDDDAYADPHWLNYLAVAFQETSFACVGGPNLVPPEDGWLAQCVGHAPGGPTHVLVSDKEAEHVPGCNISIRKSAMEAIGGFDAQFRVAADDVDICWRLQDAGFKIGFHPGAIVWHHRRSSILNYYRQQRGYGKAEVLLAKKWPEKYNGVGHLSWTGRIYGNSLLTQGRIYSGVWGTAPFQSIYHGSYGALPSIFYMPEWLLLILFFSFLTGLGLGWAPLKSSLIFFGLAVFLPVWSALLAARPILYANADSGLIRRFRDFFVCAFLHLVQLAARFVGRWPLWRPGHKGFVFPMRRKFAVWNESWQEPSEKLSTLLKTARHRDAIVACGGPFDDWDLEAKGGAFATARLLMAVEEHGQGKQMNRFLVFPRYPWIWVTVVAFALILSGAAASQNAWFAAAVLLVFGITLAGRILLEAGRAESALIESIRLFQSSATPEEAAHSSNQ